VTATVNGTQLTLDYQADQSGRTQITVTARDPSVLLEPMRFS